MRKTKRIKVAIEAIEGLIAKNALRIQKIAENSYQLRLMLGALENMPKKEPYVKAVAEAAAKAAEEAAKANAPTEGLAAAEEAGVAVKSDTPAGESFIGATTEAPQCPI